jgi:hypothetical protein
MSNSPANGKGAATTKRMSVPASGNGASARASVDKGKAKGLTPEQQKKVVILSAALIVLLTFLGLYVYFTYLKKPAFAEPALNGTDLEIAKFVNTPKFDQLSFDRWMLWVQTLEERKKAMRQLYADGKINKDEMMHILAHAWVAEEYNDMNKYYNIGSPIGRKERLREMVGKEIKKDELEKTQPEDPSEVKRDKNKSRALIERFPEEKKREYRMYKDAYDDVEKEVEKEEKARKKHEKAAAAIRPTTRASTTQPAVKPQ